MGRNMSNNVRKPFQRLTIIIKNDTLFAKTRGEKWIFSETKNFIIEIMSFVPTT